MLKEKIKGIIWGDDQSRRYLFDKAMLAIIVLSIACMVVSTLPNIAAETRQWLSTFDRIFVVCFSIEYLLRLWTSPKGVWGYATSKWGIVDLLAVLPFWFSLEGNFEVLRVLWLLRILRIAELAHHVEAIDRITRAFNMVKHELAVFGMLAVVVMFVGSVGIYEFEKDVQPQNFASIPHAMWFTIVTLTTVGYGDMTPITLGGRMFTALILLTGLGVVAVPTGLIASGLQRVIDEERDAKELQRQKDKA